LQLILTLTSSPVISDVQIVTGDVLSLIVDSCDSLFSLFYLISLDRVLISVIAFLKASSFGFTDFSVPHISISVISVLFFWCLEFELRASRSLSRRF
jgi:hypothetical protein